MVKADLIWIAFALLVVPLAMGQSVPQSSIPHCPSPDSPDNYPANMIRPKYPKQSLRNGTTGMVDLRALVAPDGKIENLTVLDGDPFFSQAAEAAIRKWRFHAQVRKGHAVESVYKIQVRFNAMLREANSDVELESPLPEAPALAALRSRRQGLGLEVHTVSEPGMVAPKPLYRPEPEFSETARKERIQGNADIDLVVGPDGLPRDLQLVCSPEPGLGDNALATVKQWKFAPGTKDGVPVAVELMVEVSFKLHNN